jgi:hypothetical protein
VQTDQPELEQQILSRTREAIQNREKIRAKMAARQKQMIGNLEAPFHQHLL